MSRTAKEFYVGLLFWMKGWRHLLSHRKLLALALLPLMIAVAAAAALGWLVWNYLPAWAHSLAYGVKLSHLWSEVLYYPLLISMGLLIFISLIYGIYLLQSLIAVPFYSFLADRTLGELGKKPDDSRQWKEWAAHTARMIRVSLIKTAILLMAGIVFFMFSFLPILNFFAMAGALLILASDCMDYSLEALGFGLRRRLSYFLKNWAQWFGMATGLALTLLVPGLTLLVIPGAVVGAALIVKNERTAA